MTNDSRPDRNLETATDWLLRVQAAPADPALRSAVEAWVAADPDHARAWNQARRAWHVLGDVPSQKIVPLRPTKRSAVRRASAGLAVATLAACLVLALVPSLTLPLQADYATATAERRQIALADGSVVHLAPQSAIDARFTAGRRSITLLSGKAFFQVRRDPERPFVVDAAGLQTTVLGTEFEVELSPATLTVSVKGGTVGVKYAAAAPPLDARLTAGERMTVDRTTRIGERSRLPSDGVAAWRDGRLFVVNATVAEVVEALRPYHRGWIVISDKRLAAERVTGLYDLDEPARALRALVQPSGGRIREMTPLLHILSAN